MKVLVEIIVEPRELVVVRTVMLLGGMEDAAVVTEVNRDVSVDIEVEETTIVDPLELVVVYTTMLVEA